MCWFANAFIPDVEKQEMAVPGKSTQVRLRVDALVQADFGERYSKKVGVMLTIDDGHCLCNFDEWDSLYELLAGVLVAHRARHVDVLYFWANRRYSLPVPTPVRWSPGCRMDRLSEGVPIRFSRSLDADLRAAVGRHVVLRLVGERLLHGVLVSFDELGRFGHLRRKGESDQVFFAADDVLVVEEPQLNDGGG